MIFEVNDTYTLKKALDELCGFLEESRVASERIFDSRLVACELLGNVLRHSDGSAKLHGEIKDGFVQLKILSTVAFVPPEISRLVDGFSESGRGLFLVDAVSEGRTVEPDGGILVKIKIK